MFHIYIITKVNYSSTSTLGYSTLNTSLDIEKDPSNVIRKSSL